jgi:hypothetical protein
MKLNAKLLEKLEQFDRLQELLQQATMWNTRYCPFEEKEQMQSEYYSRRSLVLHALQMGDEEEAIKRISLFIDALSIKVEYWLRTKVAAR